MLAVGCHPTDFPLHQIGTAVAGPNCIQLWKLPHSTSASSKNTQFQEQLPELSLALAHKGGLTWSVRWCPSTEVVVHNPEVGNLPRLGLLAAALGDGTVQVWPIPQLSSLQTEEQGYTAGPLVAAPPPVAVLSSRHLGGSVPCKVDWLPNRPYDLLLIACWDGTIAIAKLELHTSTTPSINAFDSTSEGALPPGTIGPRPTGMRLLSHFPADTQPLRAAWWLPAGLGAGSIDLAQRYLFLTAGHEGTIKIWDSRDEFSPQFSHQLTTASLLDATWATSPLGIMTAVEEGSIRGLLLDSASIREQLTPGGKPPMTFVWRGRNAGAQMAVSAHPKGSHVAYTGEDGVVGLARVELVWDNRKRKDHVPLLAMRIDHERVRPVLRITAPSELESAESGNEGLYCKKVPVERIDAVKWTGGMIPDAAQILHKLAWGPLEPSGAAWLAVGGAAGLIRCLKVPQPNLW